MWVSFCLDYQNLWLGTNLLRNHISQFDILWAGDRCRPVVLYQLVEAVEFDDPQEELALSVPQHFEVLDTVTTSTQDKYVS